MKKQVNKRRTIPVRDLADYAAIAPGEPGIYAGHYEATTTRLPNRLRLHRHHYFEVFWLRGNGTHRNDFRDYPIGAAKLIFISPGQVHCWPRGEYLRGVGLCFTQAFYDGAAAPPSSLLQHPFWYPQHTPPVLDVPGAAVTEIGALCSEIEREFSTRAAGWQDVSRSLLRVLLIRAQRLYEQRHPPGENTRRNALVRDFCLALEIHHHKVHSLAEYAGLLGISPDYLGEVFREQTGRPASVAMRERVVLEAKRLLAHTTMSVSEVAYLLNFQDPAYFSRYFRRLSGQSPSAFQDSLEGKATAVSGAKW